MRAILITLLLSGACLSFKLRRDIGKVRHYCKEICMGCGGEATLNLDNCLCNITEETSGTEKCLERAKSRFEYLGIQWKLHRPSMSQILYDLQPNEGRELVRKPDTQQGNNILIKRHNEIRKDFSQGIDSEVFSKSKIFKNEHTQDEIDDEDLILQKGSKEKRRFRRNLNMYDQNYRIEELPSFVYNRMPRLIPKEGFNVMFRPRGRGMVKYFGNQRNSEEDEYYDTVNDYSEYSNNEDDYLDNNPEETIDLRKFLSNSWKFFRFYFSP